MNHDTPIAKDNQLIHGYQSSPDYLKITKCPNYMTYEAMCIMLLDVDDDDIIMADTNVPQSSMTLYEFKQLKGISSTQKIRKHINTPKYTKLANGYVERKICTIHKLSCDAITNIKIELFPELYFSDTVIEVVMKINDGIVSIKEIALNEDIYMAECEFLKFPNIIVNLFKTGLRPKIDLYIHHKKSISMNVVSTIKYDTIVLPRASRIDLAERCNYYMFNTESGLICMMAGGLYGYKYTDQLEGIVSDEFRPLYFPKKATANGQTQVSGEIDLSVVI